MYKVISVNKYYDNSFLDSTLKVAMNAANKELTQLIADAIDEGWKLQGGISVSADGTHLILAQAVIK